GRGLKGGAACANSCAERRRHKRGYSGSRGLSNQVLEQPVAAAAGHSNHGRFGPQEALPQLGAERTLHADPDRAAAVAELVRAVRAAGGKLEQLLELDQARVRVRVQAGDGSRSLSPDRSNIWPRAPGPR